MKKLLISFLSIFILITNLNSQSFKGKLNYSFVGPVQEDLKTTLLQNYKVKVKNVSTTKVNDVRVFYTPLNQDGTVVLPNNGFATFPQGQINLDPGDSVIVQGWSDGWKDCNNCNFIEGLNSKKIRFIFFLDTISYPNVDRDTLIYDVQLLNYNDTIVNKLNYVTNNGNFNIKSNFKLPSYIKDSIFEIKFYLQNKGGSLGSKGAVDSWQIFPTTTTVSKFGDVFYNFDFNVVQGDDWRITAKTSMKNGVSWYVPYTVLPILKSGIQNNITITPYGVANFSIDSLKTYKTATGFWRGIFVPSDSSYICIPGQENWPKGDIDKVNSRIYKLKLDTKNFGDTAWSFSTGYETWGGAASKNGKYVIYLLGGGFDAYNTLTNKDWLGILDGQTGKKIWGSGDNLTFEFQGKEVGINKEGTVFAIGSTGANKITVFQNNHAINGQTSITKLWDYNCSGDVRKIVFTDDGQHIYVGSGDMFLRKFKVSDGTLLWKAYIGGWPFVNGLKFSTDSSFIYTGTKSFDLTKLSAKTGEVLWSNFTSGVDVHVSTDDKYSFDWTGQLIENSTGKFIGKVGNAGPKEYFYSNDFILAANQNINIIDKMGTLITSIPNSINIDAGGYSQQSWNDTLGTKLVILGRDMLNTPPRNGIGTWKITPTINRYPTLDSIPNISVSTGDSTFIILHYNDRDGNPLSVSATSYLGNITARLGNKDTLWIKAAKGYIGSDTIKVIVKESNTIQKLSVYNIFIANSSCPSNSNFLIKSLNATTICSGQSDTLTSNLSSSNQWYLNGTVINGANSVNLVATSPGFYTDTAINEAGCKVGSQKIQIIVNPIPQAPLLSRDTSNYLVSNISTGNSWYKDGTALTDTTQKIKPTTPGSYTTKTIQNGCFSAASAPYYFIVTDIINLSADEFIKLSPNPFTNQLNFDFFIKGYQRLNMELYDIAIGTKVSSKLNLTPGMPIYLGHLSSGTYVIRVTSNDLKISYQFKMVKL